ncbi:hypothetical protein ACNSOL_12070 (plasmid) [Aliarcobacter lanthieri]|uniref:hypothetical protein n=1 Tax=Aliarcobacter lanthieri TaxID=1355374 RepID=UPI003AAD438B
MFFFKLIITWVISFTLVFGSSPSPNAEERGSDWKLNDLNPNIIEPSNLKYFKFYDVLPEEINLKVFENQDLSLLGDKKLFVGYGLADPKGKNCIVLKGKKNGVDETREVCLPWWRVEREYLNLNEEGQTLKNNIFESLKKPRPPLMVNVCDKEVSSKYYPGGNVVCTTYYDRLTDESCYKNPMQEKCFVDNCGKQIVDNCKFVETIVGEDTTLETAIIDKKSGKHLPTKEETKVNLTSHVFSCGGGSLTNTCESTKDVLMFPFECKLDDPSTAVDDGEYVYCDENSPVYSPNGEINGFNGKCSDGKDIVCQVNKFQNSTSKCIEPIYETFDKYTNYEYETVRTYKEVSVDALSGEPDYYSGNENCLRSNTIQDSRNQDIYAKISGSGYLDDDVFILKHKANSDFDKIYCNIQHAGPSLDMPFKLKSCLEVKDLSFEVTDKATQDFLTCILDPGDIIDDFREKCFNQLGYKIGAKPTTPDNFTYLTPEDFEKIYNCGDLVKTGTATKNVNGIPLSCLRNDGNYTVNETVKINNSDIISVQQDSSQPIYDDTPFVFGRDGSGFQATKVVIDNVVVAPEVFGLDTPYMPKSKGRIHYFIKTWDNALSTFSLMFPFAGAYELYFYNKNGEEMAKANIDMSDFREATPDQPKRLMLGKKMALANGIIEATAGRNDFWVEWGGGVVGGKGSVDGKTVAIPNDSYVMQNSITNIIVKDLLTGNITPIVLVYPLPYPNSIFISKLKVYEHRKYRCYNDFESFDPPVSQSTNKYVCNKDQNWIDFKRGYTQDKNSFQKWDDSAMCEQNCITQNECSSVKINDKAVYTCGMRGGEDIGGDMGGNYFSNKASCDLKCSIKESCSTFNDTNCEITDESLDNQAQDFTGRSLYTKKRINYKCSQQEKKQVGCAKYDFTVTQGELNINFDAIGYETKDFSSSFEKALTSVDMLEVGSQHIWSGWAGKCVKGMKMDSSYLSDPMTIASYAMSAYSAFGPSGDGGLLKAAQSGDYGETIKTAADSINDAMNTVKQGLDTAYNNTIGKVGQLFGSEAAGTVVEGAAESSTSITKTISEWWDTTAENTKWITDNLPYAKEITNGALLKFGVNTAMEILSPTEEQFTMAQKLLNPLANGGDVSVQAYNSCLTSIGMSFPAMVGYSFDEKDSTSKQLVEPWRHPLRVTAEELQSLVQSMGKNYVNLAYLYSSDDNININLFASNSEAYMKAGQVICAGHKVSQTMDYINIKRQESLPPRGGSGGAGMATSVAINAIAMVYPVVGLFLKVAMDLYTNMFTKINTCDKEEDAIMRSMNEYKTHKFKKYDLCKQTRTYCDKYLNLGFTKKCVRDGYDFCCYDKQTTKIFAESLKEQLNHDWSNCQGITINELKDISFRECRQGEVPSINKCIATGKFDEYKNTLFKQAIRGIDVSSLQEQVKNAAMQEW